MSEITARLKAALNNLGYALEQLFQSTRAGDTEEGGWGAALSFNPRPHASGRHRAAFSHGTQSVFQSTPARERATRSPMSPLWHCVSIHARTRAGDR